MSVVAHGGAGGALPSGVSLLLLIMACAMVGAAASGASPSRGDCRLWRRLLALTVGQAVGHCVLTVSAQGHAHCAESISPQMIFAHVLAVPVCALLIGRAESLYLVCLSALSWLTVFIVDRSRPTLAVNCRPAKFSVVQGITPSPVGTRAPPALVGV
ncbi:MAG: hypothetical protein K0U69_09205 [Actinomycetia bacterium]|nr:hypothetical protein [Actinomycetes bacterium]